MRRTKNDVERLFPFLRLIRRQRRCADLRLAAAALCHDERRLSLRELALDRFRDGKLCRVKAVACACVNEVVDAQDFRGKLFHGGVKERLKLFSDSFCDGHAECRQIAGDRMHAVKAVGVLNRTGNMNGAGFQAVLQYRGDVCVILFAQKQPRLQPFPNGDDAQRLEKSAPLQFVQNIVLKLRDERHGRFPVQRLKQRLPVSGRAKKDALSRRQLYIRLTVRLCIFVLFCRSVRIVQREDGRLGVNSVVAQMAFVLLWFAGEHGWFTGKFRFQRRAGIDRVRHGANHLRIPAEADRAKALLTSIRFKDDRVCICTETNFLLGVEIADWH